jgi:hypothetical protein
MCPPDIGILNIVSFNGELIYRHFYNVFVAELKGPGQHWVWPGFANDAHVGDFSRRRPCWSIDQIPLGVFWNSPSWAAEAMHDARTKKLQTKSQRVPRRIALATTRMGAFPQRAPL